MTERPPPSGMRRRVLRGLAWKGLSQACSQLAGLVVAVLLARLLEPEAFGIAAMALVFSSLVLVFSDLALGAALVQRKQLSELDRSTAFWISVSAGLAFTLLGIGLSGPLAGFYGETEVRPLFAVLSLSFLITSLATTHEALLIREMNFRSLELRAMTGALAGAVAGVGLAVGGAGAWAIIGQQLAIALTSTILLWRCSRWRPTFRFSRQSLRELGSFSGFVMGHRLIYYLHRNADKLLIGRALGPAALGLYTISYNIVLVPFSRLAGPVQQVLYPAFSRMQDDRAKIAAAWLRVTRILGSVSVPALCGLVVVAPDFVEVVLGERWNGAAPIIQVLAWVGLLQSLQTLNTEILQALDRTSTMFRFSVFFFCAHLLAFVVGLRWGAVGVAVAYAISSTVVEPVFTLVTARAVGVPLRAFVMNLAGIFQSAVVMALVVLAARMMLLEVGVSALPRLAVAILIGVSVFVPVCAWRAPEVRREALVLLRGARDAFPGLRGRRLAKGGVT